MNISGALLIPYGTLFHLNLPYGVITVVRSELFLSNCNCQNPFFKSNTENTDLFDSLLIISSAFGIKKCSLLINLFSGMDPNIVLMNHLASPLFVNYLSNLLDSLLERLLRLLSLVLTDVSIFYAGFLVFSFYTLVVE